MAVLTIPGGLYCEALPNGQYVCLVGNAVQVRGATIPCRPGFNPLYVRCTDQGGFRFAGQSSAPPTPDGAIEWREDGWHPIPGIACGVSPCIYDADGQLVISNCSVGSQGYRFVDYYTGRIWTGDETYSSSFGLSEWTCLGDAAHGDEIYVGQLNWGGPGTGVYTAADRTLRLLQAGPTRFIRARRAGLDVAIAMLQEHGLPALIHWTTLDALRALPPVEQAPAINPFTHAVYVAPFVGFS